MNISPKKVGFLFIFLMLCVTAAFVFVKFWIGESRPVHQADKSVAEEKSAAAEKKTEQEQVAEPAAATPQSPAPSQKKFLVYIDPGHQRKADLSQEPIGPGAKETKIKVTGGATGVSTKKPEYVLTLEASLMLKEILEAKGFQVMMTRTEHDVNLSNQQRAEMANQQHANLMIRIHADGSEDPSTKGLSVLTPSAQNLYTKDIYENSLKVSQLILDEVKKNNAVSVLGIRYRDDLSGFNWAKVPVTLVEMGYMSNVVEDNQMSNPVYLRALMGNIADGIAAYADGSLN